MSRPAPSRSAPTRPALSRPNLERAAHSIAALLAIALVGPSFVRSEGVAIARPVSSAVAQPDGSTIVGPVAPAVSQPDEPTIVRPPGNVPALLAGLRPLGPAPGEAPMARMILALRPRAGAEADLERCLADLQDNRSPEYHHWLSPEQFGARFGPDPADLARVAGWLRAAGFAVEGVAAGRLAITFSGTVAQVEQAFRTPIRRYWVAGRLHQGNAQDPAIPAELASIVAGVVSLHDLPRQAQNQGFTAVPTTGHPLTPGDFAVVYHLRPLYQAGLDGTGTAIAIPGRTRIPLTDVARFRKAFGLPPRPPELILNGPDPGELGGQEAGEADLDVEWAGAVAPAATVRFVASASTAATDGVDLSAQYIVDHDLAPILSLSFGRCEPWMGAAELAFYRNLWAQAAAQGITVVVATGDSGPAGCDPGGGATGSGRAVSGLASTPYNLAVGGTQFQDAPDGWRPVPDPDGTTALGYVPEQAWNESGFVPGGTGLWASGGGTSAVYPKPGWQRAPGVPANLPQYQYRCLPDLALAAGRDGYRVETSERALVTGGTSCAAPACAAILALVVQKTGARQGSAGATLYRLASAQFRGEGPRGFHDITLGDTCVPGTQGYSCRPGYDLATGLGSLDALALVSAWDAGTGNQVFAGIRSPGTDRTVANGARVRFTATARSADPGAGLTFSWDFGDGGSGQGPVCDHTYLNPGALPIGNLVVLTVRDGTGARGTDTRTVTVLPTPAPGERIVNGGFELGALGWRLRGVGLGDHSPQAPAHQGSSCAWFPDRDGATTLLQQTVAIPAAAAAAARLSFWLMVDTRDPGGGDPFQIKVRGADGRLTLLARIGGPGVAAGWQAYRINLGAYRGQTLQLSFVAAHARGRPTTGFALDDVSLSAPGGD